MVFADILKREQIKPLGEGRGQAVTMRDSGGGQEANLNGKSAFIARSVEIWM
jgi:hypothetical protein